jgi:predicted permease
MMGDLRLAARGLARSSGFTAVVVATLALGVGLNTALFSVVNAVLFRPLGYEEPDRLTYVEARLANRDVRVTVSGGDLTDLRSGVSAFETLEGMASIRQNLTGAGLPRQVQVGWASPGFLEMLGVAPELGRVHREGDPPGTVVISHALWVDAFGRSPSVLGSSVRLDGYPATIVGVMPAGFRVRLPRGLGVDTDLWKNPDSFWQNGDIWTSQGPEFGLLRLVGRLAPGASLADAQSGVDAVVADLRARYDSFEVDGLDMRVQSLREVIVGDVRPTLLLLLGAVGLVLLIACANVANLMAVRAGSRLREMAIRLALGSPRSRVGRLMLMESLVLAVVGTGLGILLAAWAVELVPAFAPADLPVIGTVGVDRPVLGFSAALAVLTTLLVGVVPAVHAVRADPSAELGNGRAVGVSGSRMRDGLVVTQVALSLMLLIGAGLMTTSLARLHSVEVGFDPESVYAFGVAIPGSHYDWPEEAGRFYREVEASVAALPGVASAGVIWPMPFSSSWSGNHAVVEGEPVPLGLAEYRLATEAYFQTVGVPLVDGRLYRDGDAANVVLVSASVSERAWPGHSAVGRTLQANPWGRGMEDFEVIGVVGDVRGGDLRQAPDPTLYFDARHWSWVDWEVHVLARTDLDATVLLPELRQVVADLDADVPLAHPGWLSDSYAEQTASTRFVLVLLGAFALSAGVLALIGLYGVVSYAVGLRRREFGVRIALGSGRAGVQRMVLRRGLALTGTGLVLGSSGAVVLGDVLDALLFGVSTTDPLTYATTAALLAVAALVASWMPAWKAAQVDPVQVLRAE